jgi:inorganic pyrophosphatase
MQSYPGLSLVDLPLGPEKPGPEPPTLAHAIIETPRHSSNKYEYDPELGVFRLDRVLANSVHFPGDYGFIPSTIAEDGEPLDVLLIATGPSAPGRLIVVRPVAIIEACDEGEHDAKIIAVAAGEPRHAGIFDRADIGAHRVREIEHFFDIYKAFASGDPGVKSVQGWQSAAEARRRILEAHHRYLAAREGAGR